MTPEFLRKLGIKAGHRVGLVDAPGDFADALAEGLHPGARIQGVESSDRLDVIIFWVKEEARLEDRFRTLRAKIRPTGAIWAVIPKKRALRGQRGPTFNTTQAAGLGAGLVDNKDLGFSQDEYGIRFVIPLKDRR